MNEKEIKNGGAALIDPSENVKSLSEAANKRQDDLRQASEIFALAAIAHIKEMANLRDMHYKELKDAEAKRIDAIRAVDVNAVAVASERASASATVLATQVSQSADALRTLVASTATAMAEQQRQLSTQFDSRLTLVERAQYEGKGKGSVVDPQIVELLSEVKLLRGTKSEGALSIWNIAVTLIGIAGVVFGVVMALRK